MEKIRKNAAMIGKVLKILRGIVFGVGCAVLVFCVLSLFVPLDKLMDTANFTLELGPVELGIAPEFLPETTRIFVLCTLLEALAYMVFAWIALGILLKIFGTMSEGRPFAAAQSLQNLAWIWLGFSFGLEILDIVVQTLQFTVFRVPELLVGGKILSCSLVTEFDTGFITVFAVLLLLSCVFRYGEELQRQDDETL